MTYFFLVCLPSISQAQYYACGDYKNKTHKVSTFMRFIPHVKGAKTTIETAITLIKNGSSYITIKCVYTHTHNF